MKRTHLWVALAVLCSGLSTAIPAAAGTYARATKVGQAHGPGCAGGFPDLTGQCWTCPAGYKHDNILLPPANPRVCKKEGGADRRAGKRIGSSVVGICGTGWLSTHDGGCYTCPAGYSHDLTKFGHQVGVCYRNRPDAFSRASRGGGNLLCTKGFFDPLDGGSCWTCPASAPVRTTSSVKSATACQSRACGAQGERPCLITERVPSCDRGLIEDFVNNRCVPVSARAAVCMATVSALKAGKTVAGFADALNLTRSRTTTAREKYRDKANHDQLLTQVEREIGRYAHVVPELKRVMAGASARRRQVEELFSPDSFCSLSLPQMNQRLAALGLVPSFPARGAGLPPAGWLIRSAHAAPEEHFFMGYQVGVAGAVGIGAQGALLFVTDFRGNGGRYAAVGPQLITNVAVGLSPIGVQFFPRVGIASFTGWSFGAGISGGPPSKAVGAGIDASFSDRMVFQGFGISGSVGLGAIPGDLAIAATHSWKID
ncbi:MAG: hypothetical protein ACREM3_18735 [Candidatus Rokuibacteriota bacterium]